MVRVWTPHSVAEKPQEFTRGSYHVCQAVEHMLILLVAAEETAASSMPINIASDATHHGCLQSLHPEFRRPRALGLHTW